MSEQTIRDVADAIRRRCLSVSTARAAVSANDANYADIMLLIDRLDDADLCLCDQHRGRFLTIPDPEPLDA